MKSLEQLQKQLGSLEELRTIVKTMKALSAASIRQYEQAVNALDGYYETVESGLQVVLKDLQLPPRSEKDGNRSTSLAAIVFGSDHGLCGRFNEEITCYAREEIDKRTPTADKRRILAIGARAAASLEHDSQTVEEIFLVPGAAVQITATVQQLLLKIDDWREQQGIHTVMLYYNRHSGNQLYQPTSQQLLPFDFQQFQRLREKAWPSRSLPTFSMEQEKLLSQLLRQYLFVSLFRACAESQAGEHASRLAAMQSAQRNLDERLQEVTSIYRRARQNEITAELLDVVAGFESITSKPA
ncbi:MAG: F0F1 ATP synthase subunit gamma [Gammaproteobacteria bacterium]|nr:F0F1 ATP synthase subunit gamma [Gammaproteobacteria bacterium]